MNFRYLSTRLVVPLLVASILCIFIGRYSRDPWAGLTINMAAAFLGSIVTVFYIDVVLRRHQEVVWGRVRSKVLKRLERIATGTISSVRVAFGVQPPQALQLDPMNLALMRSEILRLSEQLLRPAALGVERMDQRDWKTFATSMQGSVQEIDRVLTLFWRSLDADYTLLLLEIQEDTMAILTNYSIFPDIFGVPEKKLPRKLDGSSSAPLQYAENTLASQNIEKLLFTCSRLLRLLPPQENS